MHFSLENVKLRFGIIYVYVMCEACDGSRKGLDVVDQQSSVQVMTKLPVVWVVVGFIVLFFFLFLFFFVPWVKDKLISM